MARIRLWARLRPPRALSQRFLGEELHRDRSSLLGETAELSAEGSSKARSDISLEGIYATQREYVWLTLQRMGVQRADLEDVFQDVFMIVHKRLDSYRPDAKLSAWLYGICLRSVARHRRRAFRRREELEPQEMYGEQRELDGWRSESESPDAPMAEQERRARLNQLLDTLDAEHRAVVVMYEIEELSCAQISTMIGVPVGTVHSRLHNARRKLTETVKRLRTSGGHHD